MKISSKDWISVGITFTLWLAFFLVAFFVPIAQKTKPVEFVAVKLQISPKNPLKSEENSNVLEESQNQPSELVTTSQVKQEEAGKTAEIVQKITENSEQNLNLQKNTQKTEKNVQNQPNLQKKQEQILEVSKDLEKTPTTAQTLVKSMDELIAEQNAAKSKKTVAEVDWDALFADSSQNQVVSATEKTPQYLMNDTSSLSGSAATAVSGAENQTTFASSSELKNQAAKTNTQELLAQVQVQHFEQTSETETTKINIDAGISNDFTNVKMSDGKMRQLLFPKNPEITISPNSSKLIENSIENIKISFTVLEDGSVPINLIKVENEFLIPSAIISEIKLQLSNWRFENSNSNGQASFSYSIIKR